MKIKIIKKNDDYSLEYEVGDIFDTTGMWYGGVHIAGRSGIPVSLDKTEYVVLEDEKLEKSGAEGKVSGKKNMEVDNEADSMVSGGKMTHDIRVGDVVRHFKREWVSEETSEYLYRVIAFATHTESEEKPHQIVLCSRTFYRQQALTLVILSLKYMRQLTDMLQLALLQSNSFYMNGLCCPDHPL